MIDPFRKTAQEEIFRTLESSHIPVESFREDEDLHTEIVCVIHGRRHEIEIYDHGSIYMYSDEQMFELFLADEFESPDIVIWSFARKLGHYISTSQWDLPGFYEAAEEANRAETNKDYKSSDSEVVADRFALDAKDDEPDPP